ncbi:unnamed protein product [Brassica oleracea]
MSSLLLSRLSRLRLRKPPALGVRHLGGARLLSETPLCHIYGVEHCGEDQVKGNIGRLMITDFSGPSCWTRVLEKTVPMEMMTERGTMGASHGWVLTWRDGCPYLADDLNPGASSSAFSGITLPHFETLPHCQTKLVTNVAMSSSSPRDDCILAVKFAGPQLSLCRPGGKNNKWVNIKIEYPGFSSSRVIYSKMDNKFAMVASGGRSIGSWNLVDETFKVETCSVVLPELLESEWEELDSCCKTEELVESRSTKEMFMIKRFRKRNNEEGCGGRMEEHKMWVFELQYSNWRYTQDIGDLCIFLSKSEPFCLKASSHQKCKNSIYFLDKTERGIFTIADKCKTSNFSNFTAPYFIPPQSYLNASRSKPSSTFFF